METRDAVSGVLEHPRHLVGPVLGAGEDQRAQVVLGQQREEQGRLLRLGDAVDALICPLRGGATPRDLDPRRVPQMAAREIGNLSGHRRREEQRLSVAREGGQDAGELGLEPHVQHPVRLVEDQELDVAEGDVPGLEVVDEPPGGGDDELGPGVERELLGADAHPTDDQGRAHAAGRSEAGGVLVDLDGQLARRSEHQRPRPLLAGETLHQRKDEGGSLAGAGGGAADDVLARKGRGDGSGLDRRGDEIARAGDGGLRLGREPEGGKRRFGHVTTHSRDGARERTVVGPDAGAEIRTMKETPSTRPYSRLQPRMSSAGAI